MIIIILFYNPQMALAASGASISAASGDAQKDDLGRYGCVAIAAAASSARVG